MFFTPELLSRRDSGFGLLWLAATLGSKSTFKKLQKRDVMTANISQLCTLVAQPAEPLALRLSSNLMVGVARVYKVKQEIFMSDVTVCFNALKKVIEEFRYNGDLQMAQPSVRASALMLANDLKTAFSMEYDNMIADWDNYLDVAENQRTQSIDDDDDDDFGLKAKSKQAKQKKNQPSFTAPGEARADLYLLKENHDHLFSSSFDTSFHGSGGQGLSSSQHEVALDFADDFLGGLEDLDIGADLARELGEGWGRSPVKPLQEEMMGLEQRLGMEQDNFGVGMNVDVDPGLGLDADYQGRDDIHLDLNADVAMEICAAENDVGCMAPECSPQLDQVHNSPPSPSGILKATPKALSPASFVRSFLAQDMDQEPDAVELEPEVTKPTTRKPKAARLHLDARTELTDAELKAGRAQYLDLQNKLRRDLALKKFGKDSEQIMEDLLWGVPSGVYAQALVDFWVHNIKVRAEARSGAVNIHPPEINDHDEPPLKRRKINADKKLHKEMLDQPIAEPALDTNNPGDCMNFDAGEGDDAEGRFRDAYEQDTVHPRSSEEPGQGRRASRPPSVLGSNFGSQVGLQDVPSGSQRSSLFPWDNAGASSTARGPASGLDIPGSDRIGMELAEINVRGRGSSLSRRASSLGPSPAGSATGVGFSPMGFVKMSREDFAFEIPMPVLGQSQQSDLNLVTLERNSFNFLEYAKMQLQSLPLTSSILTFDDIVPKMTSTRRVASVAFYHCLVLATKDQIQLKQLEAYGSISIDIV